MPSRSRWFVGSSSSSSSGSRTSSRAMASRFFHPPDSFATAASSSSKPDLPSTIAMRPSISYGSIGSPARAPSSTCRTVTSDGNVGSCSTNPKRSRLRTERVPADGSSRPARIRSSVDLPDPLGPMSPMWSPSKIPNDEVLEERARCRRPSSAPGRREAAQANRPTIRTTRHGPSERRDSLPARARGVLRGVRRSTPSSSRRARPARPSWASSTGDGEPLMRSAALAVLGNAITSRRDDSPARIIASRSSPSAMPPCGGVPNCSASMKNPKRSRVSSSDEREQLEDLRLQRGVVDSEAAAADLERRSARCRRPSPAPGPARVSSRCDVLVQRRRERMVHAHEALGRPRRTRTAGSRSPTGSGTPSRR